MKSISHIKRQPHHTLMTRHQLVRGEKFVNWILPE